MQKVQMVIGGKQALVDADQVKKHINKQLYVARAIELQDKLKKESDPICKQLISEALNEQMGKIIRLNRTIRQNVQFLKV